MSCTLLALLPACTLGDSSDTVPSSASTDDAWVGPDVDSSDLERGGLRILTGMDAVETAGISGPEYFCGETPPVVLGDLTGDSVPELLLGCRVPDGTVRRNLHVLDGAAVLDDMLVEVGAVEGANTDNFAALGDLDDVGFTEVGFRLVRATSVSGETVTTGGEDTWLVRPGASFLGESVLSTDSLVISGRADGASIGPPQSLGDMDGDGVSDIAVAQLYGTTDPVAWLVSGAAVVAAATLSAPTEAFRTLIGFQGEEEPVDFAPVGDVDGDGQIDLATVLEDHRGYGGDDVHMAVTIVRGTSVSDLATTMRIHGSEDGPTGHGDVEPLPDLDGDGLPELAVMLTTYRSSTENSAEVAVIPSAVLVAGVDVDIAPYALGGSLYRPYWFTTCDLDGDGLPELVSDDGIWDGRDLLVPGAAPVGPGARIATCAGDLDGAPGSELVVGTPDEW